MIRGLDRPDGMVGIAGEERGGPPGPGPKEPSFEERTRSQLSYLEARNIATVEAIRDERAKLESNVWYFLLLLAGFCLGFCLVSYFDANGRAYG